MNKCINHPTRIANIKCKRCHMPICQECRIQVGEGVFCSDDCIGKFREFQGRVSNISGLQSGWTMFGILKYVVLVAVLCAVIYGALFAWLGTSDPGEMWRKMVLQIGLLF